LRYLAQKLVEKDSAKSTKRVKIAWALLVIVMICLYIIFK
jgi:hypothetical protein